jgi:hypothetical protein
MSRKEMLERIDSDELAYWYAIYVTEGFPDGKDDIRAARHDYMFACANAAKGHKPRWKDYLVDPWEKPKPKEKMDWQVMQAMMQQISVPAGTPREKRPKVKKVKPPRVE